MKKETFSNKVFTGTHYGVEVHMCIIKHDVWGLKWITEEMEKENVTFNVLPVFENDEQFDVLEYTIEGQKKYCIIDEKKRYYFVTGNTPVDGKWKLLVEDVISQRSGELPTLIESKFKVLLDMARENVPMNRQPYEYVESLEGIKLKAFNAFKQKARKTMTNEKKKEYSSIAWMVDPIEQEARKMYWYWEMARYLQFVLGYGYEHMEYYAELDHHDVTGWKEELEYLHDGFYWREALKEYIK